MDYDGTYTSFPELMDMVIDFSHKKGYRVILCTMRNEDNEKDQWLEELSKKVDKMYFTNRKAKRPFLLALGITPDIWIDDSPWYITNNA